jgi:hypothetical protein
MGAEPYWYFVKYEQNINEALQKLRQQEFQAGRYNPVIPFLDFPINSNSPCPGPQHKTIQEALDDASEEGTRSILDIEKIADEPGFGVAAPLDDATLEELYGTTKPTREMVEDLGFLMDVERGHWGV